MPVHFRDLVSGVMPGGFSGPCGSRRVGGACPVTRPKQGGRSDQNALMRPLLPYPSVSQVIASSIDVKKRVGHAWLCREV